MNTAPSNTGPVISPETAQHSSLPKAEPLEAKSPTMEITQGTTNWELHRYYASPEFTQRLIEHMGKAKRTALAEQQE